MDDWKGRFIEEDDPPEPTQPHCPDCGAFLSWKPAGLTPRLVYADIQQVFNEQGDVIDVIVRSEEWEDVEYWRCKKCGKSHSVEVVFVN